MTGRSRPERTGQDDWDLENAVKHPAVKNPRAVVSVAFRGEDFDAVEIAADRAGMKLSEFIREAALARARPQGAVVVSCSGGAHGSFASAYIRDVVTALSPNNARLGESANVTE